MVECLVAELADVGLSLNTSTIKLFSTEDLDMPMFIDVADGVVEVVHGLDAHKYLGRMIPGDLKSRSEVEFASRLAAAWGRFHKH